MVLGIILKLLTIIIGIIVSIYYSVSFFRILRLEYKINVLYKQWDKEKKSFDLKPMLRSTYLRRLEQLERDYKSKINPIERRRRFILDKLPFIRK